jgi:hypothetical protein
MKTQGLFPLVGHPLTLPLVPHLYPVLFSRQVLLTRLKYLLLSTRSVTV